MANIVYYQNHLEKFFHTLKRKRNNGIIKIFLLILVALAAHFTILPLIGPLICFIILAVLVKKSMEFSSEMEMIKLGLDGEKATLKVFENLPDTYTVFSNLEIEVEGKKSQLDHVVVGSNGIFIIETKNLNGTIDGHALDRHFLQSKVGRGGTSYSKQFYNPIKQVSANVFRLSRYLKANGVDLWVQGVVYFSNPAVQIFIHNGSEIPIFTYSNNGRKGMIEYILNFQGKKEITSVVKTQIEKALAS